MSVIRFLPKKARKCALFKTICAPNCVPDTPPVTARHALLPHLFCRSNDDVAYNTYMFIGLTHDEAKRRLNRNGPNALPKPRFRALRIFASQFRGIFNILLILASLTTFLLGEPVDGSFILVFVCLSIGLSFFQEYKSDRATEKLRSFLQHTVTVCRDGADVEIPTHELVVGDIMKLESGDIIPADAVVRHTLGVQVDESSFTGESVPVPKMTQSDPMPTETYTLLQGTALLRGMAYAEVTATGINTRLAHIAKRTETIESSSDLAHNIDRISVFIVRATVLTLIGVIVANIYIEGASADIPHLLIFAIALAISVIPEALPLVITFSLSHGALRLAKKHVIVKRLSSVQDLGAIDLLCTDKTGTITENKLVYVNEYIAPEAPLHPLVLSRLSAHDLNERSPEPFDRATDSALREDQRAIVSAYTTQEEEAFDPALRSNGAIVSGPLGSRVHIRRGSPDQFIEQGIVDRERIGTWLDDEEKKGRRVLCLSYDVGEGPRFGGCLSFIDVLKPSTESTIHAARELNVALTIITGDSQKVAESVGREVGLVDDAREVMNAHDFFALPVHEQHDLVDTVRVFARTTPEQKVSLIELLKERHTVGFLGEGINDAAALKTAHVSMVVRSASDIARETADIVLLRSDLHVIIQGIRLGRETHANTIKYIRATLISNFGNFYAVAIGSLFISFLPMLPKQLLLLNLLSDFPMMAIAFDRVSTAEITRPQKYDFRALYITFITLGLVSTAFDFIWFALFYTSAPSVLQTNWFMGSVLTELLLLFSIRSMLPIERAGKPAPILLFLSLGALASTILLPYVPLTAHFFELTPPSGAHITTILTLSLLYFIITEFTKRPLFRALYAHKELRETALH